MPRNARMLEVLGTTHFIERYGTGLPRTIEACTLEGTPLPELSDKTNNVLAVLRGDFGTTGVRTTVLSRRALAVLRAAAGGTATREQLQLAVGLKDKNSFIRAHLNPLVAQGLLEYVYPDAPNRPDQAYRLSSEGSRVLAATDPEGEPQQRARQ